MQVDCHVLCRCASETLGSRALDQLFGGRLSGHKPYLNITSLLHLTQTQRESLFMFINGTESQAHEIGALGDNFKMDKPKE